jgi:hypothetical protein
MEKHHLMDQIKGISKVTGALNIFFVIAPGVKRVKVT